MHVHRHRHTHRHKIYAYLSVLWLSCLSVNCLLHVPVNVASLYVVHVGFVIIILRSLMMCSFNTNCTEMKHIFDEYLTSISIVLT